VERAIAAQRMLAPGERLLVAVSGGKDSLALWDLLADLGYDTTGLYLGLAIGEYSDRSQEKVERFAAGRGLPLRVVKLEAESPGPKLAFVKEFLRTAQPAFAAVEQREPQECAVCGMPAYGALCSFCSLVREVETRRARTASAVPA